ncbi:MAG: sel1 repeat family protein [Elusimicrobia bacterium]|nr:sel1 repeat family protein [Elusimicrobiota bacterium]MDE2314466.1 sel1 repeat family protein [Elusimicrobiota bacterium]
MIVGLAVALALGGGRLFAAPNLPADPEGQYALAQSYYYGRDGIKRDCAQALYWWRKAAGQGHDGAMYDLGGFYLHPDKSCPVKRHDYARAMRWFRRAAAGGDARAMTDIGVMYDGGLGVRRSGREAFRWFVKAAHRGDGQAMINIGRGYAAKRDYAKAMEWYKRALSPSGGDEAAADIGDLYRDGLGVAKNQKEAQRWYRISGAFGEARLKGLPACGGRKAEIGRPCSP